MHQILHIFRKDVRRLWPLALAGLALLVADTFSYEAFLTASERVEPEYRMFGHAQGLLIAFTPAIWWFLAGALVQQEALAGDRQFWLTRPYSRWALLAAKGLAVLSLILLPAALADAVSLRWSGFDVLSNLTNIVWKQVLLFLTVVAPAAALAAVTRTNGQFMIGTMVSVAAAAVFLSASTFPVSWGSLGWVKQAAALPVLAAGAAAVLGLQYFRRATFVSRLTGLVCAATAAMLAMFLPWETAFAVQARSGPAQIPVEAIGLTLDRTRDTVPRGVFRPGRTSFAIPVKLSQPPGMRAEARHLRARIEAAGVTWESDSPGATTLDWVASEENYRLVVAPDHQFLQRLGQAIATVRITAYLDVLGDMAEARLPAGGRHMPLRDVGICSHVDTQVGPVSWRYLACRVAFRRPDAARVFLERQSERVPAGTPFPTSPNTPYPHDSVLKAVGPAWASLHGPLPPVPGNFVVVETWKLKGHLHKEFVLEGVRLADYLSRQP